MKLFIRVLSLALIAVLLCLSLVACAKRFDDGEYVLGDVVLTGNYDGYIFEGKTFTYRNYIQYQDQQKVETTFTGEYELEIIEQEDEEDQLEDEENGITRGNIIFTYVDASGATVTKTFAFVHDEFKGLLEIHGHLHFEENLGPLYYTLNDTGVEE